MAQNRTYDEIAVGDTAVSERVVRADDLFVYAHASGNLNPMHLPGVDRTGDGQPDPIVAPSLFVASLASAVIGNRLPGPGTLYLGHQMRFHNRARVGDLLKVVVEVTAKGPAPQVELTTTVTGPRGLIADGRADVAAPTERIEIPDIHIPDLQLQRHRHFERLIAATIGMPALKTAVACPDDRHSLSAVVAARDKGLIDPILVGSLTRMRAAALEIGLDLTGFEIEDIDDEPEAAARAIALVHEGRARAVMKGHLHSDALLAQVVKKEGGLRTARRLSHVFVIDVPGRPTPILISDAAINIAPDLTTKVDIVQNAIDLARAIGIATPRVGVLSAVETVNPAIPSTIDAAVLSKMAERGQIKGGIVDGPLAMDNAVDMEAARTKGITSLVAGRAEVLIVPNLEAGNMLAKELTFLAGAEAAGLVMGAQVPVILTSRADSEAARLASCALALVQARFAQTGEPLVLPVVGANPVD